MSSLAVCSAEFLDTILRGSRSKALEVVREATRVCASRVEVYVEIFQESLYEVGRLWETNRITVADEHLATAVAQYVLAQMYFESDPPLPLRGNAVITGVEGELHSVGAQIVADAAEHDGWNVRLLGSDVPLSDVLGIVEYHEAAILGLSVTLRTHVPAAVRLISELRQQFGSAVRVVVGGGAFRSTPDLAEQIGADGFAADVQSALQIFRKLPRQQ